MYSNRSGKWPANSHFVTVSTLCLLVTSVSRSRAAVIERVTVGGEHQAEVLFHQKGRAASPNLQLAENRLELTWPLSELGADLGDKLEMTSPHPLIHRITLFPLGSQLKAHVAVRGSLERLQNRVKLTPTSEGLKLYIDFPEGALGVDREKLPVLAENKIPAEVRANSTTRWGIALIIFLAASVVAVVAFREVKKRSRYRGSRKYLIEQVSFAALGPKTGVALLRVHREFLLVGITPQQVTLLAQLPKLSAQFEEESAWERSTFNEALQEQVQDSKVNLV